MKARNFLFYIVLLQLCMAHTCNRSSTSELLTRLYRDAYIASEPFTTEKEPVESHLLGSWMVEYERMMVITQKEYLVTVSFLSNTLGEPDDVFIGHVSALGSHRYLNLLIRPREHMFFRIDEDPYAKLKLNMLRWEVNSNPTGPVKEYLKQKGVDSISRLWRPITLVPYSDQERELYMKKRYEGQVRGMKRYEHFKKLYPDHPKLDSLREAALNYDINQALSVEYLCQYMKTYPETELRVKRTAKKKCTNTSWCVDYLRFFPNDPVKDSIVNLAFSYRGKPADYILLLDHFPGDPRTGDFAFEIALMISNTSPRDYFSERDFNLLGQKLPDIAVYSKKLEALSSIRLDEESFYDWSYALTPAGKATLDRLAALIDDLNAQRKQVKAIDYGIHFYSDHFRYEYWSNRVMAENRAIAVKKYLVAKYPDLAINGVYDGSSYFSEKEAYYRFYFNKEIPRFDFRYQDKVKENLYVRNQALEEFVLDAFKTQVAARKSNTAWTPVIPVQYWDEAFTGAEPGYAYMKKKLLRTGKKKKFDAGMVAEFVLGKEQAHVKRD